MKSCDGCNEKTSIPYAVHEATVTRLERINTRLWVVILILIFALIASNLAWIIYEKQFDVVEKNVEIECQQGILSRNSGLRAGNCPFSEREITIDYIEIEKRDNET